MATSATRAIQNNFLDSSKQDSINLLLLGGRQRTTLDDVAYTLDLTNSMHGEYLSKVSLTLIRAHKPCRFFMVRVVRGNIEAKALLRSVFSCRLYKSDRENDMPSPGVHVGEEHSSLSGHMEC